LVLSRRKLVEEHAAHLAKSMYLANMSHELRTPLNAIIGFSEMMTSPGLIRVDRAKCSEFAADIHGAAGHLLDLINDILDMSRIEAGRLDLHPTPTDLEALLASCQRMLGERARQSGIDFQVRIETGLPMLVCDTAKLKQIVLNLAGNAIKFTRPGGHVAVEARMELGTLRLVVADNGIGIAREDIPRVLTPFLQAAHSHLGSVEGSGLGLPLSKRLVELHGGSLALESEPGRGTRVTVTLPTGPSAVPRPVAGFEPRTVAAGAS
jgi:signal transduction histidine kinase